MVKQKKESRWVLTKIKKHHHATGAAQQMLRISSNGAWSPVPSSFLAYSSCFPLKIYIPPWEVGKFIGNQGMRTILIREYQEKKYINSSRSKYECEKTY